MTAKRNFFVPLIINGVDVKLPNPTLTFRPDSLSASKLTDLNVTAQGADVASCHAAVDSCAHAFDPWRKTLPSTRRALFLKLADILRLKSAEIVQTMTEEIHATSIWANINLEESILMIQETAALTTSSILSGTMPPSQDSESQALVFIEPLGVILGIAPWNSPLILGFRACLAAIAAGNSVVLKGSELSPRTHYFIADLFRAAGFPPGVCNFLLHRNVDAASVVNEILERQEVRKCNFTGSTPVGRLIASKAARELKPCLLELGGKNFAIVTEDADVERAAKLICDGAFLNNGQICMSTDTVLVVQPIYDELRKALLAKIQSAQYAPEITPLITTKAANRVSHLVADAVARGATAHTRFGSWSLPASATDGDRSNGYSAEVPAILLERINANMEIASQESFGPIVCLVPVASADEAIQRINACKYGLSSSIHTKNHYSALSLAKKLKVSATHINGATIHDESTHPHGGHGDSGWGRFGGHWGLLEFVHTKTIMINP